MADEVRRNADVVALVGSYVPLKKRGREYVGHCCFHLDKSPSLYVTPTNGLIHCFGCGWGGDVIKFVMEKECLDCVPAMERIRGMKYITLDPNVATAEVPPAPERITCKPPSGEPIPSMKLWDKSKGGDREPITIFPLKDFDGEILAYEARYSDPKDKCRMWTYGARGDRKPSWGCGHWSGKRPLYGLDRFSKLGDKARVLVTEGPKKADSAHRLLGERYVCVSWTGGAEVWEKHNWEFMAGREVTLWPDADSQVCNSDTNAAKYGCALGDRIPYHHQPGPKAMLYLADYLTHLGCKVRLVNVTDMSDGWDIADAEKEGWDAKKVVEWAKARTQDFPSPESTSAEPSAPSKPSEPRTTAEIIHLKPEYQKPELTPGTKIELTSRPLSKYTARKIRWLWPNRIPIGKITLIAGEPGLGKSSITAYITAIVSTGGTWAVGGGECKAGRTLFFSAEDDPDDTIKPRMIAAGANMENIEIINEITETNEFTGEKIYRGFSLTKDIKFLEEKVDKLGNVRLIIIDPVTAYTGEADTHKVAEVRAIMSQLHTFAIERKLGVILVTHLNKNAGNSDINRITGSNAFPAAARIVYAIVRDPDEPRRRLMLQIKSNNTEDMTGMAYTIVGEWIESEDLDDEGEEINTSVVEWEPEAITKDGASIFQKEQLIESPKLSAAAAFLRDYLRAGPLHAKQVLEAGEKEGHKKWIIRDAAKHLGIDTDKKGGMQHGPWIWALPEHTRKGPPAMFINDK